MFGYIRPHKAELRLREFEEYRGIYCGLCRDLGKRYGLFARMTLSYDCTFYALLLLGESLRCGGFYQGRCRVNPLKKCTYCGNEQKPVQMAAAVSVILAYEKLLDDFQDGGLGRKTLSLLLRPLASRGANKAGKEYPRFMEAAQRMRQAQKEAEEDPLSGLDACAHPTAQLLQELFSAGQCLLEVENSGTEVPVSPKQRIIGQLGYHLGRWVYLMDACDDLQKDIKKKRFNPLIRRFGLTEQEISPEKEKEVFSGVNEILNMSIARMSAAFELLEHSNAEFEPILRNIILQGLPQMQKEILFQKKEQKDGRSV